MNGFMIISLILNILISLFTVIETIYKKKQYTKKYDAMSEKFVNNLKILVNNIDSSQFEIMLKDNGNIIETNTYNDNFLEKNKNRYLIYIIMNESCKFFSDIYNDKDIYCNIRINKNKDFYTIAHFRSRNTISIKDRLYYTEKNTDLIGIASKNFNKFIISNIDDFKDSNIFMLQNYELKNRCKAIMAISLKTNGNLLGVYTIYFSKPLDDKIKLINLDVALSTFKRIITDLVKEYIELNEFESINNTLIENKITN